MSSEGGEFLKLQSDENVRDGSEAYSQQAPASNPGYDEPSGGIAAGSGGGDYGRTDESNQVSQATSDSYARGGTDSTTAGYATGGTDNTTGDYATDTTNEANKAASDNWTPGGRETTTGGSATDTTNEANKVASDNWTPGGTETTTGGSITDTGNEQRKVAGDDWTPDNQEGTTAGNTSTSDTYDRTENTTVGDTSTSDTYDRNESTTAGDTSTSNTYDTNESTSGGDTSTSDEPKKATGGSSNRENVDAIPTAGGERLGEKHWGESKQVPDVPKLPSESQVASEEGQPDKMTQDNTSQNTGGAAPPGSSSADNGSEGKLSIKDKIKDKLNIGSKDN